MNEINFIAEQKDDVFKDRTKRHTTKFNAQHEKQSTGVAVFNGNEL